MQDTLEFDHLYLVAQLAMKRGERGIAERLFLTYSAEAAGRGDTTEAECKAQMIGALLAPPQSRDASNLPAGAANPWAAAQKFRRYDRDNPAINFKLTDRQIRSAESIQKVFHKTTRALSAWQMPLDSIQVDTSKSRKDPWLALPAWVHRERIKVYLPWLERCGQIYVIERQYQSLTVVELVMLILIDGYSVRAISKSWRADPKRLRREFRRALDGYADIKRTAAA